MLGHCGAEQYQVSGTGELRFEKGERLGAVVLIFVIKQALAIGAVPKLVKLSLKDVDQAVRKKAIRALSSTVRNYQPALDEAVKCLPSSVTGDKSYDAGDMDSVDSVIQAVRDHQAQQA